ncbi:MAG: hypothetical protein K2H83_01185, partial [Duncaniella sp.]|nr:hypothetical protein [Duncaniella sp.]
VESARELQYGLEGFGMFRSSGSARQAYCKNGNKVGVWWDWARGAVRGISMVVQTEAAGDGQPIPQTNLQLISPPHNRLTIFN